MIWYASRNMRIVKSSKVLGWVYLTHAHAYAHAHAHAHTRTHTHARTHTHTLTHMLTTHTQTISVSTCVATPHHGSTALELFSGTLQHPPHPRTHKHTYSPCIPQTISISTCSPRENGGTALGVFSGTCDALQCESFILRNRASEGFPPNQQSSCVGDKCEECKSDKHASLTFNSRLGTIYFVKVVAEEGLFDMTVSDVSDCNSPFFYKNKVHTPKPSVCSRHL
jgi:hypothetical protein